MFLLYTPCYIEHILTECPIKMSHEIQFYFKHPPFQNSFWHSLFNSRYNFLQKKMNSNVSDVPSKNIFASVKMSLITMVYKWCICHIRMLLNKNLQEKMFSLSCSRLHISDNIFPRKSNWKSIMRIKYPCHFPIL